MPSKECKLNVSFVSTSPYQLIRFRHAVSRWWIDRQKTDVTEVSSITWLHGQRGSSTSEKLVLNRSPHGHKKHRDGFRRVTWTLKRTRKLPSMSESSTDARLGHIQEHLLHRYDIKPSSYVFVKMNLE